MAPFESVDAYIAAQPPATHAALACVRRAIRKALPKACETIAYNMPAYSLGRVRVLHFAAWKQHYALYVATQCPCRSGSSGALRAVLRDSVKNEKAPRYEPEAFTALP